MKTHIALETTQLDACVGFYEKLLGTKPAKHLDDYALFVLENPGLELAIDRRRNKPGPHSSHYGLVVDSSDEVTAWIARLEASGLTLDLERDVTCCYAREDKAWATDPDGRRWEVYAVLEETAHRSAGSATSCCADDAAAPACC